MKITGIRVDVLGYRYNEPIVFSHLVMDMRKIVLVRIITDEGIIGLGDADAEPTGDSIIAEIIKKRFEPLLIGENPLDITFLINKISAIQNATARSGLESFAVAAIDVALWDIAGKVANLPISILFGRVRTKTKAYASWSYDSKEAIKEKMALTAQSGFSGAKIRIGLHQKTDYNLVKISKEILGDARHLMVDVNSGWSPTEAITNLKQYEEFNLKWIEEPVDPRNLFAYRELKKKSMIPIAIGEHQNTLYEYSDMLRMNLADYYQPDVRAGGISNCLRISHMVNGMGYPVAFHCFGSAIKYAATLQLIGSIENSYYLEWNMNYCPLKDEICTTSMNIKDGYFSIPDGPGLGIELNEDAVKKYTLSSLKE